MTKAFENDGKSFLSKETMGGLLLMVGAIAALIISNSPYYGSYQTFLDIPVAVSIGAFVIDKPLLLWVNDGLMAVFFFLVGLEIKREVLEGKLSSVDRAALPLVAAIGGMAVPALVFSAVNLGSPENLVGWAIPAATDIAFALGILALLGPSVPTALKVFLLGIAIIDDLGAILAIAIFYTADLSVGSLVFSAIGMAVLLAMNRLGVRQIAPYALVGLVVWAGVLKSGVHATLAGVVIALMIPVRDKHGDSPLEKAEHGLFPWVSFFIMPLFAFANAGVNLSSLSLADTLAPLPLGIVLGLFVGKQLGVMSATWLSVRAGICRLPDGVTWLHIYGVACLTGIGFTMSLFIGTLAFDTPEQLNAVRLGVLMASACSALAGVLVLRAALAGKESGFSRIRNLVNQT
jgi:NhaA family Na+:H+ antiporter